MMKKENRLKFTLLVTNYNNVQTIKVEGCSLQFGVGDGDDNVL